ncbi:MAG: excinuclease ABC subunit UvrC [Lentisphaeria bacterium]|nr:excinuclease ABC subunit UvrC [Lentisphaeria bacterium]
MKFEEYHPAEIPARPGVYMFRDRFGRVIYVGKARDLRRRLGNYFQPSRRRTGDPKLRSLINSIAEWSYTLVRSEDEALLLESQLIKSYAPHYNILMRDDKRYLLLKVDFSDRFPTLALARLKKPDNARYYGPFPHGTALKMTREFLLAYFGLRGCRNPDPDEETRKHCLKKLVKDCCAPCTGAITCEEYRRKLDAALEVLEGNVTPVREAIRAQMLEAAGAGNFEKAARLRDTAFNIDAVFGRRNRVFENPALPGQEMPPGERAVRALAEKLGLKTPPRTILCFDISNILGTLAVASMVTFTDGRANRSAYRRFRIRTVNQSNDFAMMKEAVGRHFSRLMQSRRPLPDLLMVDGGKGQLSSAVDALLAAGVPPLPVIGLAKRNEEIFIPGRGDPLVLDRHDPALRLLQSVRDESHRFAITYHRSLREKRISASVLDDIPGVGDVRKRQLLRAFGSVESLLKADAATIAERVRGIGLAGAEKIVSFLAARKKAPTAASDIPKSFQK